MLCLSIRQPWAWLILHGDKDVENRTWQTNVRGRILIHASKGMTDKDYDAGRYHNQIVNGDSVELPRASELEKGGIVGEVEIVDCVRGSRSLWFEGPWGFVLKNPKPLPFRPCKGALGFFNEP